MSEWTWNSNPLKRRIENLDSEQDGYMNKYAKLSDKELKMHLQESLKEGFSVQIPCTLSPSCSSLEPFKSIQEYEDHYQSRHCNVCHSCQKQLPTGHLLDLHLQEMHDSYFEVISKVQNSFSCFVEGCKKKFKTKKTRILHLIQKHEYPKSFDFTIVQGKYPRMHSKKSPKESEEREEREERIQEIQHLPQDLMDSFTKLCIPRSVQLKRK